MTMKAIQVHKFVDKISVLQQQQQQDDDNNNDADYDDGNLYISMKDDVPKPTILKENQKMIVKVLACSISPGDIIMLQGNMIILHPSSFPYIPGMDICGKIVDNNSSTKFKNGDIIVASNDITPIGGMAEYMIINEKEAVLKPAISNEEAASCSSAITARNAVMDYVKKGDRVLVLGGSGGVGSAAIQIAKKHAFASFVATTSTQIEYCTKLGADLVINYKNTDWWKTTKEKYDVIIDTVGGGNYYGRAAEPGILKTGKEGGTFVAVTGDDPKPDCRTYWKLMKFFGNTAMRLLYTYFNTSTLPKYVLLTPYDTTAGREQVLKWMEDGSLIVPLEKPIFPFTAKGVRDAFVKVASGHAHGKVVVQIAKE